MKKGTSTIVVSNNFIEAYYRVDLLEKKLMLLGILKFNKIAGKEATKGRNYTITATSEELQEYLGLNIHDDYANLKNACKKLNKKVIEIKNLGRGRGFSFFSLVTDATLKNGLLTLSFHWQVFPYFKQLRECYTKYDLLILTEFNSIYTIRFYGLIKQYEGIGSRTLNINEIKKMLDVKAGYKLYADLKTRVIEAAYEELKAKSSLYFEYREIKVGRKVVAIELDIKRKGDGKQELPF